MFAPAKNHATIAITATLEGFSGCWTISPVYAAVLLLVEGLLGVLRKDEGCGHVGVRGIRVHKEREERKGHKGKWEGVNDDPSIRKFRA